MGGARNLKLGRAKMQEGQSPGKSQGTGAIIFCVWAKCQFHSLVVRIKRRSGL